MKRVILLWLCLYGTAEAATYYLDGPGGSGPGGSDANDGLTVNTAWATLLKAYNSSAGGDTILIRAGNYDEGSNFSLGPGENYIMNTKSGSSGDRSCWRNYPGDAMPRIMGDSTSLAGGGDTTSGCILNDFVTLDSLKFVLGFRRGIHVDGSANSIIQNCVIDSNGMNSATNQNPGGISAPLGHVDSLLVQNCTFRCNKSSGIHCEFGPDSMTVINCRFTDNEVAVFLKVSTEGKRAMDVHIYNNIIENNSGARFAGQNAVVWMGTYCYRNIFIHHNLIKGNGWTIADAAAFRVSGSGGGCDPFDSVQHYVYIYNNTVDLKNQLWSFLRIEQCDLLAGVPIWDTSGFFNNMILNPHPADATYDGVLSNYGYECFVSPGSGCVGNAWDFDYNLIYDTSGAGNSFFWWQACGDSPTYWTHAQWVANKPYSDFDVLANPLILEFTNYSINGTSPAAITGKGGTVPTRGGGSVAMPTYIGWWDPGVTPPASAPPGKKIRGLSKIRDVRKIRP